MSARTTVSPPMPESNTPIGLLWSDFAVISEGNIGKPAAIHKRQDRSVQLEKDAETCKRLDDEQREDQADDITSSESRTAVDNEK